MTAVAVKGISLTIRKDAVSRREPPVGSTLGEAIRWYADHKHMSLAEVGKKAGLSRTVMSLVSRDMAGTKHLAKLEEALGIPHGSLSRYEVTRLTPDLRAFLKSRPRLTAALQRLAVQDTPEADILALLGVSAVEEVSFRDLDDEVEERLTAAGYALEEFWVDRQGTETIALFRVRGPNQAPRVFSIKAEPRYSRERVEAFIRSILG